MLISPPLITGANITLVITVLIILYVALQAIKKRFVTSPNLEVNKKDVICLIVITKLKYLIYWGFEDLFQYGQHSPLLVESDFMLYVTI